MEKLVLVDVSHVIYPFYHGLPKIVRPSDNFPTGAIHGVCSYFWYLAQEKPSHVAVVYDAPGGSRARREKFPEYKANRPPLPEDLSKQFPVVRRAADVFGFARVEIPEYESDDVVATYCRLAAARGMEVVIVSSDKDLAQLVRWDDGEKPPVSMYDPRKDITYNPDGVRAKWGVHPHQIADWLALMGDATDNVPGIDGVGKKYAAGLLEQFGNLETVLASTAAIKREATARAVATHGWKARLAKTLTVLDHQVPVEQDIAEFSYPGCNTDKVLEFLAEMDLVTLRETIEKTARVAA